MYRSTKGASKARRDQINAEIRNLRDLLPISDADKARLSYLHIMSIACMYTRKCVFFSQDSSAAARYDISSSFMALSDLSELVHTLPGFLMLLTSEGKLLYLTDNVTEHLGHSMVDLVAQSDSVFDILDPSDHFVMRSNLVPVTTPDTERLFRCRFNTSKLVRRQGSGNKMILVRAHCLASPYHASSYWTTNSVWVCFCSPLELHTSNPASSRNPLPTPPAEQAFQLTSFQSQHSRDMRIQAVQECVSVYLGYDVQTLCSHSWYSLLHPRDLSHASTQHCTLLREGTERQVEMVVQVEAADHSWVWLYMVLQLQTAEHPITCQNYVISESEAWSVRQQLQSEQNQLALLYQEGLVQQFSPLSSPDQVFTPSSSGLSAQSFDFNFTVSGRSSSEELPGSTPQSGLTLGSGPSFPVGEDISQPHESQQVWLPEARNHSTGSVHPSLGEVTNMADIRPASQAPAPLPNYSSKPQSTGEFVCTPPYTPRLHTKGSCFMFGEEFLKPDKVISSSSQITQASQPACLSTGIGLALGAQHCHRPLYEKLPPSPDTSANDDCILMTVPEITGPLYVDVPHSVNQGPPDCLLTPEASPTERPCLSFFPQNAEKERLEISLLAQYLSSIAEGFWKDHPLTTRPSSPAPVQEPLSSQNSVALFCEFPPTMCCEELCSSLAQDHTSLEKLTVPLLQPSHTPPHCSLQHTPPAQKEEALVGVQHLCSVQSTHCNGVRILESGVPDVEASTESALDEETSPPLPTSCLHASLESTPGPVFNPLSPGLPCAQSLLEELVSTEPVFEAAASINPALRQQSELYQLPFQESPQHFYQDGTGDHMF